MYYKLCEGLSKIGGHIDRQTQRESKNCKAIKNNRDVKHSELTKLTRKQKIRH